MKIQIDLSDLNLNMVDLGTDPMEMYKSLHEECKAKGIKRTQIYAYLRTWYPVSGYGKCPSNASIDNMLTGRTQITLAFLTGMLSFLGRNLYSLSITEIKPLFTHE